MKEEKIDIDKHRSVLKANWSKIDNVVSDQRKGIKAPSVQKSYPEESNLIDLVSIKDLNIGKESLLDVINKRESRRHFTDKKLTLEELSFLLWATQGVKRMPKDHVTFRTVPSAGSRHTFETYLYITKVEGLQEGLYRYLSVNHKLLFLKAEDGLNSKLIDALYGQNFNPAVTFIWTTIPYRMEWRYSIVSHKIIALDAGHVCQNLYLAAESIGGGTCAIGAYDQDAIDKFIEVDGKDEFTIYIAPVGKV